jgi:GDPmannose 4,6-dehydratase
MGNINAKRDWGHAKDYVRMQWMMLQQEKPEDFVIATGYQYSVRQFIEWSAKELGIYLEFIGEDEKEHAVVTRIDGDKALALKEGDIIVRIDPRYYRPSEVETLLGDPTNAKNKLGWVPEISMEDMIGEMVTTDLKIAQSIRLLKDHGYDDKFLLEK